MRFICGGSLQAVMIQLWMVFLAMQLANGDVDQTNSLFLEEGRMETASITKV